MEAKNVCIGRRGFKKKGRKEKERKEYYMVRLLEKWTGKRGGEKKDWMRDISGLFLLYTLKSEIKKRREEVVSQLV